MNTMILHKILLSVLVALQVIGPSWVVALHTSEAFAQGPKSQARIAGLRGVVTVTPATDDRLGYAPKYRSSLTTGDVIATEEESIAELLLDSQGLFTIQEYSEAILGKQAAGDLSLYLQVGAVEGSLPMKGGDGTSLTVSTPNIRATTNGGLITAEVQPTLGETVKAIFPDKSFVVRTSLRAQSNPPGKVALLETFCVKEGTLQVEYPGTQAEVREQKEVPLGQCVGFYNGVLRAMGDESHIADWRAICVVGNHCEIPDQAKKLIAKKQMGQALALEQALMGSDPEDPKVDEQIIIATTGISLGASINDSGSEVQVPGGAPILPTTGEDPGDQGLGGSLLPTTGGVTLPPVVGVSPPPSGAAVSLVSGNIQSAAALTAGSGMVGGWGLLSFLKGDFTADKELLLADSGNLAEAPHLGKVPQSSLVVEGLSPNGFGSPSNQKLPLLFRALTRNFPEFKQKSIRFSGM